MAKTGDENKAALLVIDVQNGVMDLSWESDRVISNIAKMVDHARACDIPVVWIQHESGELPNGTPQWEIVPALHPAEGEHRVYKTYSDSFVETELGSLLEDAGIGHLVVSGAQTNACVRNTTYGAIARGYDVTLVEDAHTTESFDFDDVKLDAEQVVTDANLSLKFAEWPGQQVGTATTADVLTW